MKIGTWILAGIVLIVTLRLAVQAGVMVLCLIVVLALLRSPGETLKAIAGLALISVFMEHPLFAVSGVILLAVFVKYMN